MYNVGIFFSQWHRRPLVMISVKVMQKHPFVALVSEAQRYTGFSQLFSLLWVGFLGFLQHWKESEDNVSQMFEHDDSMISEGLSRFLKQEVKFAV